MALQQVGGDHIVAGVIHVQIWQDDTVADKTKSFSAKISAPGFSATQPIQNGTSKTYTLSGVVIGGAPVNPQVKVEIDDFSLVPPTGTPTALKFLVVFKLIEIFQITIGSVPVTAAL